MAFGNMLNPVSSIPNVSSTPGGAVGDPLGVPAQDPIARRKFGWQDFFTKLSSNPNLQQTLLTAGAQLLQPRKPGQSEAGAVGQALAGGAQMYRELGRQDTADLQTERRVKAIEERTDIASRGVDVSAASQRAQADAQNRTLTLAEQRQPKELEQLDAAINYYKARADYYGKGGSAGTASSSGNMQLAAALAASYIATGEETDQAKAFQRAVRETVTNKGRPTPVEFEAKLLVAASKGFGLMEPEQIAKTQEDIKTLRQEYERALQLEGAGRLGVTGAGGNQQQAEGDAWLQQEIQKRGGQVTTDQLTQLQRLIKEQLPGWNPTTQ